MNVPLNINLQQILLHLFNFLEKFFVGRVARVWPATFDIVKTETVQESCYLQLVRQGQTDFPILVTVAEGRVVQKNFHVPKDKKNKYNQRIQSIHKAL